MKTNNCQQQIVDNMAEAGAGAGAGAGPKWNSSTTLTVALTFCFLFQDGPPPTGGISEKSWQSNLQR